MHRIRAALLLDGTFEEFYGAVLRIDQATYLREYRNDWAWTYVKALEREDVELIIYIPSLACSGLFRTGDNYYVRFVPPTFQSRPFLRFYSILKSILNKEKASKRADERRGRHTERTASYLHEFRKAPRYLLNYAHGAAFWPAVSSSMRLDGIQVLFVQDHWRPRFDHVARRCSIPFVGVNQGADHNSDLLFAKRITFPRAAGIICQTRKECNVVERFGGKPLYAPNGIDTVLYAPRSRDRGRWIFTVARLVDAQKRISDLIRSLGELPQEWRLVIAGDGPDAAELASLATKLGVGGRVIFLGFVGDHITLRNLYCECGVFALVSVYEGLSLAVLEAMSCGAPVVTSDIAAFEELVTDGVNGRKITVGEVSGIARAVLSAFENRSKFGEAARETVEKQYSYRSMSRILADVAYRTSRS